MYRAFGIQQGDGVDADLIAVTVSVPDSGTGVLIGGNYQVAHGGSLLVISGSPLTGPAVPVSGTTWWVVQINTTTGAASIKTSSSAQPAADAGCTAIFASTVASVEAGLATMTSPPLTVGGIQAGMGVPDPAPPVP